MLTAACGARRRARDPTPSRRWPTSRPSTRCQALEESGDITEQALELAQRLGADDAVLANLFNSRGIVLGARGRRRRHRPLPRGARLARCLGSDGRWSSVPLSNLGDAIMRDDPPRACEYALRGQDLARQIGARYCLGISVLERRAVPAPHRRVGPRRSDRGAAIDGRRPRRLHRPEPGLRRSCGRCAATRPEPARCMPDGTRATGAGPTGVAYHAYTAAVVCDAEGDAAAALDHAGAPRRPSRAPGMDPFVLAWPLGGAAWPTSWGTARPSTRVLGAAGRLLRRRDPADGPGGAPRWPRPGWWRTPWSGWRRIEDAVTDLRAVGSPYHVALALLDLAEAQPLAGKDPSDVIAEAATIGATLGSPQVVERAESLRPRRPGDARTAP